MAYSERTAQLWWQRGIIYQIYPLSFADSNGDGKGDLQGIEEKLDYLSWLGVDAIWISPIYPSPLADFGYDVSDYCGIHPMFGTMDDFDRLLDTVHAKGMKLILDLVPNHTSDRHPWFVESRSSRDNPKRDWYLWYDPAPDGGPPNNWLSTFGGSGWQFDAETGQYYYHAFLKEQPDLNWRNPEVQKAMADVMRFWLKKGVDGFRVDVIWHLIKDDRLRNNPPNPDYREGEPEYDRLLPTYSADRPEVQEIVSMMRRVIDEFDERVLIGEIYLPVNELVKYYGEEASGAHLPLNFQLILLPWKAKEIFATITEYLASVPSDGWPDWVLSNHDKSRVASRAGSAQIRVAALLLLTLRGTPVMYYGDEIGMHDVEIPPGDRLDPAEQRRDPQRTPMQWNAGDAAGFTSGTPWLPLSDDYRRYNVETERDDDDSTLSFYRRLIELRRKEPALSRGSFAPVGVQGGILAYIREDEAEGKRFLIMLNLEDSEQRFHVTGEFSVSGEIIFASDRRRNGETVEKDIRLAENEGIIVRLA